jgi:hypothetical protein
MKQKRPRKIQLTDEELAREQPNDPARYDAIHSFRARLIAGCSEEEFNAIRCPVCGDHLTINVHNDHSTFSIRCKTSSLHVSVSGQSGAKPEWWRAHMRGGWY